MRRALTMMLLLLSITLPTIQEIDAYQEYDAQLLVMDNEVDSFKHTEALRHIC